jgi:hypothetical protein
MEYTIPFTIRAQAQNGMFLGPDSFNGAIITITDRQSRAVLATGLMDTGDSGTRQAARSSLTSPYPITTPTTPTPTLYWVLPGDGTVAFEGSFAIAGQTDILVSAHAPMGTTEFWPLASVELAVGPGSDLTQGPGVVVPVPGLWVQPELIAYDGLLRVRAKVTMVCGCEINAGSPWLPGDFVVTATVASKGQPPHPPASAAMTFQVNSQFYADFAIADPAGAVVTVAAKQLSSGLAGQAVQVYPGG